MGAVRADSGKGCLTLSVFWVGGTAADVAPEGLSHHLGCLQHQYKGGRKGGGCLTWSVCSARGGGKPAARPVAAVDGVTHATDTAVVQLETESCRQS